MSACSMAIRVIHCFLLFSAPYYSMSPPEGPAPCSETPTNHPVLCLFLPLLFCRFVLWLPEALSPFCKFLKGTVAMFKPRKGNRGVGEGGGK